MSEASNHNCSPLVIGVAIAGDGVLNKKPIPVVVGRGGPGLIPGLLAMERSLEELGWPYTIFGPDTPITMVAEYAAALYKITSNRK